MIIVIGGLPGVGKTTLAKAVKYALPTYDFYSTGNTFRKLACEWAVKNSLNLSEGEALMQYEELAKRDVSIDRNIDKSVEKFAEEHSNCVIESRLAWYFVPRVVKHFNADGTRRLLTYLVICSDKERFSRISKRQEISEDDAKIQTLEREAAIAERYPKVHQIQFSEITDKNNFHHSFNSGMLTIQEEVDTILFHLRSNGGRY